MARPEDERAGVHSYPIPKGLLALMIAMTAWYIYLAPFTKVEESFNIQAIHDLCHHGFNIKAYDHIDFPGVVPRTFIGALAVALPACPLIKLSSAAGLSKLSGLYIARISLAGYSLAGLIFLRKAVAKHLGQGVGNALILLICSQFHLLYYASRPLPNTLALPLVAVAAAMWLSKRTAATVCILTFTTAVFRCDLAPLLGLFGLQLLLSRKLKIAEALRLGISAAVVSIGLSICIDSVFWRYWLWPEGAVLWFNTAKNRSSEWGTQPLHWYFTSALLRALLGSLPLAALGIVVERRVRTLTAITLLYIGLYSLLPHKELRFLLPVLPLLNIPAAVGFTWLWRRRLKSGLAALQCLLAVGLVALSFAATLFFLAVSRLNYPGGEAMLKLHQLSSAAGENSQSVHIDVLPAMTGVTRFGEQYSNWTYSKEENLGVPELLSKQFTYLLSTSKTMPGYNLIEAVSSFSHIEVILKPADFARSVLKARLPLKIVQHNSVFIHRLSEV